MTAIGKKWNVDEEAQLVKEITEGKKYDEIAEIHERNINGIKSRHVKLVNEIRKMEKLCIAAKASSLDELVAKINLRAENIITNPLFDDECCLPPT
jgi:hypothetical protein